MLTNFFLAHIADLFIFVDDRMNVHMALSAQFLDALLPLSYNHKISD